MSINFQKSFSSIFSSQNWQLKLIFPLVMAFSGLTYKFLPQGVNKYLFVYMLITLLPSFIYSGFVLEFVHNEIYDISPKLPTLKSNIIKFLKNGIKYLTVSLTYTVFLLLIMTLLSLILGIFTGVISGVLIATHTLELNQLGSIIFFLWITLFIIILVPTLPIIQTAFASYADNFSFKHALNLKRIFNLIMKAKNEFILYTLLSIIIFSIEILIIISLGKSHLLLMIAPFKAVIGLIWCNIGAQVYKIAKYKVGEINENELEAINNLNPDFVKPESKKLIFSLVTAFIVMLGVSVYGGNLYVQSTVQSKIYKSYTQTASIVSSARNFKMAEMFCKKAISLNPKKEDAYITLADVYLNTGEYGLSLEASQNALRINPNNAITLSNIGDAYKGMGYIDEANKYYQKARKIDPNIDMFVYLDAMYRKIKKNWIQEIEHNDIPSSAVYRKTITFFKVSKVNISLPVERDKNFNDSRNSIELLFRIDKTGKMNNLEVLKSSGISNEEKEEIISAINSSTPFSPLPEAYKGKNIKLKLLVSYAVNKNHK